MKCTWAPASAPASAFSHFLYSLDFSMSGLYASAMLISWTKTSSAGGNGSIDTWFWLDSWTRSPENLGEKDLFILGISLGNDWGSVWMTPILGTQQFSPSQASHLLTKSSSSRALVNIKSPIWRIRCAGSFPQSSAPEIYGSVIPGNTDQPARAALAVYYRASGCHTARWAFWLVVSLTNTPVIQGCNDRKGHFTFRSSGFNKSRSENDHCVGIKFKLIKGDIRRNSTRLLHIIFDSDLSARADDWKAGRVNPKAQARNDGTLACSSVWLRSSRKSGRFCEFFIVVTSKSHRIHVCYILYMVPLYVSTNLPAPWILWELQDDNQFDRFSCCVPPPWQSLQSGSHKYLSETKEKPAVNSTVGLKWRTSPSQWFSYAKTSSI